jgi:hypothetical protein
MPRSPQRQFRYRLMAARGCGSVSQSPEHAFRPHARRAPHHESAEYVDRGRSREVARGVTELASGPGQAPAGARLHEDGGRARARGDDRAPSAGAEDEITRGSTEQRPWLPARLCVRHALEEEPWNAASRASHRFPFITEDCDMAHAAPLEHRSKRYRSRCRVTFRGAVAHDRHQFDCLSDGRGSFCDPSDSSVPGTCL